MQNLRFVARIVVLVGGLVPFAACGSSTSSSPTMDSGTHPDSGSSGAGDGSSGGGDAGPPVDKTAITTTSCPNNTTCPTQPASAAPLSAMTWTFVPIDGAICRDGSPTGIGINMNPASKNLAIYLEGGGACFNALTCGMNPKTFGATEFNARFGGAGAGILNRADTANPIADWNFVYVPFCTGDVHAGNKRDVTIPNVTGTQQFVGYENMSRYLARLVPTFPQVTKVLLTGISAGGFGAAANYPQTARAFGSVPVYSIDDSGPPMGDPYVPKCLQKAWTDTWGFDKTILADCGADCPDPTNYTIDATIHTLKSYPNIPFGVLDSAGDGTITFFYGFGANNCMSPIPTPLPAATFTAGLLDSRMKISAYPNAGSFIFPGNAHTSLGGTSTYDSVTAGGGDSGPAVKLSDWVTAIVNTGKVTNVGP